MYEDYARIRDSKGYSDYGVAKGTGISAGIISDWKKGRYNLKAEKLAKIAEFLEVSVDELLGVPNSGHHSEYYIDEQTAQLAQQYFDDPMTRALFDARQGASPEDVQIAIDLLNRLKRTNPDG